VNFDFTEEQAALEKNIETFARREMAPLAKELDQQAKFSWELWRKMGDLGYLGLSMPEEYGGMGLGAIETSLCLEAAGRGGADAGTTLSWAAHVVLAGMPIALFGTEEQKRKYLPKMAAGEWVGAYALTEPNAGSDAGGLTTYAVKKGDKYVLNGSKMFITNGPIADVIIVFASTDKSKGSHGISTFIIEKDFPGFSVGKKLEKMGNCASPTAELIFDNCLVPEQNLLGPMNEGFKSIGHGILTWERAVMMGLWVGLMEQNMELCLRYAQERVQFNRPIAKFQAIQHKLADMKMDIEAARLIMYQVGWLIDQGKSAYLESAVAKLFVTEATMRNVQEAVQIHGGYGLMKEYDVERNYRDAKLGVIGGGSSEIQRGIIAKQMLNGA